MTTRWTRTRDSWRHDGQFVEVPMFEVLVSFNLVEHINGAAFEPPVGPLGYQRVTTASRRPFPTKDGHVCILPYSDKQWLAFFTAVGRPELMERSGFATYSARVHTVDELYGFVASVTLCLRLHGVRGWGRDGLGTGARGRGSEGAEGVDVAFAPRSRTRTAA
jgi:crotonobetainyl-CoA:carnitine CoA-transferase CaiB-like acyl-CoA transferase